MRRAGLGAGAAGLVRSAENEPGGDAGTRGKSQAFDVLPGDGDSGAREERGIGQHGAASTARAGGPGDLQVVGSHGDAFEAEVALRAGGDGSRRERGLVGGGEGKPELPAGRDLGGKLDLAADGVESAGLEVEIDVAEFLAAGDGEDLRTGGIGVEEDAGARAGGGRSGSGHPEHQGGGAIRHGDDVLAGREVEEAELAAAIDLSLGADTKVFKRPDRPAARGFGEGVNDGTALGLALWVEHAAGDGAAADEADGDHGRHGALKVEAGADVVGLGEVDVVLAGRERGEKEAAVGLGFDIGDEAGGAGAADAHFGGWDSGTGVVFENAAFDVLGRGGGGREHREESEGGEPHW